MKPSAGAVLTGVLFVVGLLLVFVPLFITDSYLHKRQEKRAGLNVEAFRGALLGPKVPGELRIAVVGDSTAFGFGVTAEQALPAQLQVALSRRMQRPVSVANLAYDAESAVCLPSTLRFYDYLEPDAVLVYMGVNDLRFGSYLRSPATCTRNRSAVFRFTGYLPILPEVLRERSYQLRYSSLEKGYAENQSPVIPSHPQGALPTEATQDAAAQKAMALSGSGSSPGREDSLNAFASEIVDVAASEEAAGRVVFVSFPPVEPDEDTFYWKMDPREEQARLREAIEERFKDTPAVRYLPTPPSLDPASRDITIDGTHMTPQANKLAAEALAVPIAQALGELKPPPASGVGVAVAQRPVASPLADLRIAFLDRLRATPQFLRSLFHKNPQPAAIR